MEIHIDHQNKKIGPFSLSEVNAMLHDGRILPSDLAWHEDLSDWVELHTIDGIVSPIPSSSNAKAKKSTPVVAPKLLWIERVSSALVKKFAIVMCLIFIIGFFGSIAYSAYSWIFSNNLNVPKYDEISSVTREGNYASGNKIDLAELDKKRHIEKKYGDDLSEILKTYKLPEQAYEDLKQILISMPTEYHKDFISGLKNFLSDATNEGGQTSSDFYVGIVNKYCSAFQHEIVSSISRKGEASRQRWIALAVAFGCCLLTFLFVSVPALLRIEENTRKHGIPGI